MITAFSREGAAKVYVQHRLKDHAGEVSRLVGAGANLYVCGNARNMAQEVKIAVSQIISDQRGILLSDAQEMIKTMKASGNYLVGRVHAAYSPLHFQFNLHGMWYLTRY